MGNPIVSLSEDAGSAALTAAAFVIPVIAFALAVALVVSIVLAWRRLRRQRAGPSPAG
jgi:flagellar biosynthesis protein FliQ